MDPDLISFILLYRFTITRSVYFTCITIILLPLDTLNPLFKANRWDWQPHRKLEAKFLVVLCAGFTLLLVKSHAPTSSLSSALVRSVAKLASITFWSLAFSYWFDLTLVSQLREDLLLCSSYLPLGVPNGLYLHAITHPLGMKMTKKIQKRLHRARLNMGRLMPKSPEASHFKVRKSM
jgi:hypothetical protein